MAMRKLFYLSFCFLSMPVFGQLRKLSFDRLSVENGLPENFATCTLQDKQGYIWFGTQNGLVRYDGYKVKVYNLETADNKDRSFRSVWSIMEDKNGVIWVGTYKEGVFRYNSSTDNFTQFKHAPTDVNKTGSEQVITATDDKEGHIWAISISDDKKNWHLDRIDPKTGKFTSYDSLSSNNHHVASQTFNDIKRDASGNIWVAGSNGLYL